MELALSVTLVLVNISLAMAALRLIIIFSGSAFSDVAQYMLVLALSLIVHTVSEIFFSGRLGFFIFGVTATMVSLSYLLVVYGVFIVLKNISERGRS